MRRFLLLALAPLLVSATDPLRVAEQEAAAAGRRPAWLLHAPAGGEEEQVRLAALVRALGPEVERRSAALRGEAEALAATARAQQALREKLGLERKAAAEAQKRFAAREAEALAAARSRDAEAFEAGDTVLDRSERLAMLAGEAAQRRSARTLAAALARLPVAEPRPFSSGERAEPPPFAWSVPAGGAVTVGVGELRDNGVRSRGVTLATVAGTNVVAPADGRIAFAGPFRARAGVIIIDHGGGWATLLTEVRPSVRVGERVVRGQGIGRALAPVTAELFKGGRAEPAALLARS
jgi:septal ring factor EnvC (AmiA/AmiB activator)